MEIAFRDAETWPDCARGKIERAKESMLIPGSALANTKDMDIPQRFATADEAVVRVKTPHTPG